MTCPPRRLGWRSRREEARPPLSPAACPLHGGLGSPTFLEPLSGSRVELSTRGHFCPHLPRYLQRPGLRAGFFFASAPEKARLRPPLKFGMRSRQSDPG